jgi:hypothetical protein
MFSQISHDLSTSNDAIRMRANSGCATPCGKYNMIGMLRRPTGAVQRLEAAAGRAGAHRRRSVV